MHKRLYRKGQKVWTIFNGILVKCSITEINDLHNKSDPHATVFYWVDEPIGHSLAPDEFCTTFRDAISWYKSYLSEVNIGRALTGIYPPLRTLNETRRESMRYILATQLPGKRYGNKALVTSRKLHKHLRLYPEKKGGVDWFNKV